MDGNVFVAVLTGGNKAGGEMRSCMLSLCVVTIPTLCTGSGEEIIQHDELKLGTAHQGRKRGRPPGSGRGRGQGQIIGRLQMSRSVSSC